MLLGICLLLLFAVVVLAVRLAVRRRALRAAARQLRERTEEHSTARLLLDGPDCGAEELLCALNALLESHERERMAVREREEQLREQIASLSHDLRTPLTAVQGYCQLLRQADLSEEDRQAYLAVLEERAAFLQRLINDFYELSRLESGAVALEREPVSLSACVASLLADHYDALEQRNFQVEVWLSEGLPDLLGDGEAVRRILQNLMRNSLEHGSGSLFVEAVLRDDRVCLRWENGGAALTEEELSRVFDRCYTRDAARSGQNMGLGLAIAKALAKEMGAAIWAELQEDRFAVCISWKRAR